jgi:transcriptional regulator with PAS, ATPase and Fis domain
VQPSLSPRRVFPTIAGESAALHRALAKLSAAIESELPALLVGETGVGKELFARAIHDHGARASSAFVPVNCAAIPDALFEAELFGHARGAFTGADRARAGLFARAEGGTLFLDEIGELSLGRQASLLRVLESQRYRPVGSDEERASRARIVAATNRDLTAAVAGGTFRQDLFFRLNVLTVRIPPLAERNGDVVLLARRFLETAGSRAKLTAKVEAALSAYSWPGNVRELSHVMTRLATLSVPRIELAHLPRELRVAKTTSVPMSEGEELREALASSGGNISQAAKSLGLTRHGLKKRMVRLGMRAAKVEDDGGS